MAKRNTCPNHPDLWDDFEDIDKFIFCPLCGADMDLVVTEEPIRWRDYSQVVNVRAQKLSEAIKGMYMEPLLRQLNEPSALIKQLTK